MERRLNDKLLPFYTISLTKTIESLKNTFSWEFSNTMNLSQNINWLQAYVLIGSDSFWINDGRTSTWCHNHNNELHFILLLLHSKFTSNSAK